MKCPIICAGFHRSGTSLVSEILSLSGLPYAIEKMPGNFSNPDGHFEDLAAMRMHDSFLSASNTTWQYSGESLIDREPNIEQHIRRYTHFRYKLDGDVWLMKDPRASLYLEEWKAACDGKARFVIMYRHWGLCIQSLLKRHSQEIAFNLPGGDELAMNLEFWRTPELAAKMWVAYNEALIDFIQSNKDICLVISQSSVIAGLDVTECLNNKFGLHLVAPSVSPVNPSFSDEKYDSKILDSLSGDLIEKLNDTFNQLQALCDFADKDASVSAYHSTIDHESFNLIRRTFDLSAEYANKEAFSYDFTLSDPDELMAYIKDIRPLINKSNSRVVLPELEKLELRNPYRFDVKDILGRVYFNLSDYHSSLSVFNKAVAIGSAPPYIMMYIGDCHFELCNYELAEYYYLLAYTRNPKNPMFSLKLGYLYHYFQQYEKSLEYYDISLGLEENDWTKIKKAKVLEDYNGLDESGQFIESQLETEYSSVLSDYLYMINLMRHKQNIEDEHYASIKKRLSHKAVINLSKNINRYNFNHDLLTYWLYKNYSKLFTREELSRVFISQVGESPSNPKISIIVNSYNMNRELPRTVQSLLPPYQRGLKEGDVEVIVVDNGSSKALTLDDFPVRNGLKIINNPVPKQSPVEAVNLAVSFARSEYIGVLIDGARMASPGLLKYALYGNNISEYSVVSSLGFHLGPEVQMDSVPKGYNQALEDQLLKEINWVENGYQLFNISSLAGSSSNGYFAPIAESNAVFLSKAFWHEVGGYDTRFQTPGGGFANLDLYKRLCEHPKSQLTTLLNEGTFHQVHGGVATNGGLINQPLSIFQDEYFKIRGESFEAPKTESIYLGGHHSEGVRFLQGSLSGAVVDSFEVQKVNRVILENSLCNAFDTKNRLPDTIIDAPIIITGRGGSGTRLLSSLMQGCDIFLGNEINETEDSTEWVPVIYDMVTQRISRNDKTTFKHYQERLRSTARNILEQSQFTGGSWGFKLPEAILCLPELLAAFPNAKVLHLTRHPISISMRRSHVTSRLDNPVGKRVLKDAYESLGFDANTIVNHSEYFNNAISWEYQLSNAITFLNDKIEHVNVRYEDILKDPLLVLNKISSFLEISVTPTQALDIDHKRSNNKILDSTELSQIWQMTSNTATQLGYTYDEVVVCD